MLGDSRAPEVTGNESDNYTPAAENPDLPILFPTFNSGVWFCFVLLETILTFHLAAGNFREQTTAAQRSETKEKRKKGEGKEPLLRFLFFFFVGGGEGERDFVFHNREHYNDAAPHNENLVFY